MSEPILQCRNLCKGYPSGDLRIEVLRGLDLSLERGEMVAVTGESGVGKSTLIHLVAALDVPDSGTICVGGRDLQKMDSNQRAAYRNREIGLVFQLHHLFPEFTALENVVLPQWMQGKVGGAARRSAEGLLQHLGLGERMDHLPGHLSGGEQQRVAIARALANSPALLLADEPTGNLDVRTAEVVFDCLRGLNRESGLTILLATHNQRFADLCDRTLALRGGRLTDSPSVIPIPPEKATPVSVYEE